MAEIENGAPQPQQEETKKKQEKSKTPMLDTFGKSLTKMAIEGKLEPVIGREKEIDRVIQILSRKKKNNPILVGEPGVGKSCIAYGLALKIVEKKVSRILHNKKLIELDLSLIVAGTKYRGQFEERMKAIIEEIVANDDIIVFVDEIHTMVGSGNSAGGMDGANMLKPALSRGEIQMIGATTVSEFKQSFEKDGALNRRFQRVSIEEPSKDETKAMLKQVKVLYEDFHKVSFSDAVIDFAVELSDRYISGRHNPDKSIDTLDECGSRIRIDNIRMPEGIIALEKRIDEIAIEKDKFVKQQKYEDAAKVRDEERRIIVDMHKKQEDWNKEEEKNKIVITEDDVASVIANMTGIPVKKLTEREGDKLIKMPATLKQRIIGQDEAVQKVSEAIQIARSGLSNAKKPVASFLFLGGTGCGKTECAKALAEYLFNDETNLIRLDMSEYHMEHTTSRLIGSPPGFVGSSEGGQLTEKVKNKPFSVVLLDEIEKAHSTVHKIFLQILDEGEIFDAAGVKINFKNTIIIMTSNIGSKELLEYKRVGFDTGVDAKMDTNAILEKALKKTFPMEFINRIDEKVIFNKLSKENINEIVEIHINKFIKLTKEQGFDVDISKSLNEKIAKEGFSDEYGARPVVRACREYLQKPLSLYILSGKIKKDKMNKMDWDSKKEEVTIK